MKYLKCYPILIITLTLFSEAIRAQKIELPELGGESKKSMSSMLDSAMNSMAENLKSQQNYELLRTSSKTGSTFNGEADESRSRQEELGQSFSFPLGDYQFSLGRNLVAISSPDVRFRVGGIFGSGDGGSGSATRFEYAKLVNDYFAIGGQALLGEYQKEVVGRGVFLSKDKEYELDAALSFMKATPLFDFDSGSERVSVSQPSGIISLRHLYRPVKGVGLHSVGASLWAAHAQRSDKAEAKTVVTESPDTYDFLYDPRQLALGRLRGTSLDLQYAPLSSLVFNGSFGAEEVVYSMADGSRNSERRPYISGGLKMELAKDTHFNIKASDGISKNFTIGLSRGAAQLSVGVSEGRAGALSNKTIMLDIDLGKLLWPESMGTGEAAFVSLAERESFERFSSDSLIDKASSRPVQLPQNILAKVDRTGVQRVSVKKQNLAPGTTISGDFRELFVPVGVGALKLVSLLRNGVVSSQAGSFVLGSGKIVVNLFSLPSPSGVDRYVIRVIDASGATYDVKVDVAGVDA